MVDLISGEDDEIIERGNIDENGFHKDITSTGARRSCWKAHCATPATERLT